MKYLHKFESDTEFKPAYTGETYQAPWASITNETGVVNNFKGESESYGQYVFHYDISFYKEVDGLYKWLGYEIENPGQALPEVFWTRTRNPEVGDKTFNSYEAASNPEETGWLTIYEVNTESGRRVDYNRKPYFNEGFVFDATDYRVNRYGVKSLACLNIDEKVTTPTSRNLFTNPESYQYSTCTPPDGTNMVVKIVNAKEIDQSFDDEIVLTIPFYHGGSFSGEYRMEYEGYCFSFLSIYWWIYDGGEYDSTKPGGPGFEMDYYKLD